MSRMFLQNIDDTLVQNLRSASRGIKTIGSKVDSVLNNPITQFASVASPVYGVPTYAGLTVGNKIFKSVGAVSDGLAGIIDRRSYHKKDSTAKVLNNVLERVPNTVREVAGTGIKFV